MFPFGQRMRYSFLFPCRYEHPREQWVNSLVLLYLYLARVVYLWLYIAACLASGRDSLLVIPLTPIQEGLALVQEPHNRGGTNVTRKHSQHPNTKDS